MEIHRKYYNLIEQPYELRLQVYVMYKTCTRITNDDNQDSRGISY